MEHNQKFLDEVNAREIARVCTMQVAPNSREQTQDTNAELLRFLKHQTSEDQIEVIFEFTSEQIEYRRISEFAAEIPKKLQQSLYRSIYAGCMHIYHHNTLTQPDVKSQRCRRYNVKAGYCVEEDQCR